MLLLMIVIGITIATVAILIAQKPSLFLIDIIENTFPHEPPDQRR